MRGHGEKRAATDGIGSMMSEQAFAICVEIPDDEDVNSEDDQEAECVTRGMI